MVFTCDAVDTFYRYTLHRNVSSFKCCKQFFREIALNIFFYKNFVKFLTCLDGFNYGAYAKNHFVLFYHTIFSFLL